LPYFKDLYPEAKDDIFDPNVDLKEATGNEQPGGGESFSLEGGEAKIVYELLPNKRRSFLLWLLGFSWTTPPANTSSALNPFAPVAQSNQPGDRMFRRNPQAHPVMPWLRAAAVTFSGFPPAVQTVSQVPSQLDPQFVGPYFGQPPPFGAQTFKTLKSAALFPNFGPSPVTTPTPEPFISTVGINTYMTYQKVYATVTFKSHPWEFFEDYQIPNNQAEIYRNCFFDLASSVEMLSAENGPIGQMQWNETDVPPKMNAGGVTISPTVGTMITKAFGTLVSKNTLLLNWMWVPQEHISIASAPLFNPTNILNCIGTVNSTSFAGQPAGTLLMQPPKYVRFKWPATTVKFAGSNTGVGFYGYNIIIPFQKFDPQWSAPARFDANGNQINRGWRLLPWAPTLGWYEATRLDGRTHLLLESDHNAIFNHATF
jgi:hypothetical protein